MPDHRSLSAPGSTKCPATGSAGHGSGRAGGLGGAEPPFRPAASRRRSSPRPSEYRQRGYPVSPTLGRYWQAVRELPRKLTGRRVPPWFDTFAPEGRAPAIGDIWRSPDHARTLRQIAETAARPSTGATWPTNRRLRQRPRRLHDAEIWPPSGPNGWSRITSDYRGYDVWEIPPNGQGMVALMALNILRGSTSASPEDGAQTYHLQIEAIKLAFADGQRYIADPGRWTSRRRSCCPGVRWRAAPLIGRNGRRPEPGSRRAAARCTLPPPTGRATWSPTSSPTTWASAAASSFPAPASPCRTAGHSFPLDPDHPNRLEPGKRPYNTIIPGFLTRDGQPSGPFGVMGGFMQPQGHLQVVGNASTSA